MAEAKEQVKPWTAYVPWGDLMLLTGFIVSIICLTIMAVNGVFDSDKKPAETNAVDTNLKAQEKK